jgi:alpha-L-fucosidase
VRRFLLLFGACCLASAPAPAQDDVKARIAPGPFQPDMQSLQGYTCPDWFRDAKFGIWAHWGPQAVPEEGDWYARKMYEEGSPVYASHLAKYGHPSEHGYKDIIPLWKAENWDPDRLMSLYKKAGAKYFVSMGSHHDNFFLWNSKVHRWNAVAMGPMRDVVGDWQKAAQKQGLKFGVSEHLGASFTWFQPSHRADKSGPKAGVPYDGADPKYEDLYHFPARPDDTGWYSNDPRWHREWFTAIKELVDTYQPDLLYTDGGVPFGNDVGLALIAHLYNSNAARNGGTPQVVYNCKQVSEGRWVEDLERGVMPGIRPHPWQTDTSIGDWYYNKNWKYRGTDWVVHMLIDIVSKNGNLLINVVQRPDGSLDPEAETILAEMAEWIAVHGEAIYGTRPWLVHGEGPVRARGGNFKEDFAYTARDIRFTSKGDDTLYVFALGWPSDGKLTIRSLAQFPGVTASITNIGLLGYSGPIPWTQNGEGLTVTLPDKKPSAFAVALKISGKELRGFKPELAVPPVPVVQPEATGALLLKADEAELQGQQLKLEDRGGQPNVGFWDKADESVNWRIKTNRGGKYRLTASIATAHDGAVLKVDIAGKAIELHPRSTGAWDKFVETEPVEIELPAGSEQTVKLGARDAASWKAVNLRSVKLAPMAP